MDQTLLNLVLALSVTVLSHGLGDALSARAKVARLATYIAKKPYQEPKLNINTRLKANSIATTVFIVMTAIFWGVFTLIDMPGDTALKLVVVLLTLSYFVPSVIMDLFHADIERVTKPFKS